MKCGPRNARIVLPLPGNVNANGVRRTARRNDPATANAFPGRRRRPRALSCITEDGRWLEPSQRVIVTTIDRKEDPPATTSADPDARKPSAAQSSELSDTRPASENSNDP
jgi:hypothetical protein